MTPDHGLQLIDDTRRLLDVPDDDVSTEEGVFRYRDTAIGYQWPTERDLRLYFDLGQVLPEGASEVHRAMLEANMELVHTDSGTFALQGEEERAVFSFRLQCDESVSPQTLAGVVAHYVDAIPRWRSDQFHGWIQPRS